MDRKVVRPWPHLPHCFQWPSSILLNLTCNIIYISRQATYFHKPYVNYLVLIVAIAQ